MVSIVAERPTRLLLDMRIVSILGSVGSGLDRRGNGCFRRADRDAASLHIYVADKGDYYEIADGLPQHGTVPPRD